MSPEELDTLAARIADVLGPQHPTRLPLLTVDQVAARLNVAPDFVYRHQAELGAVRLGPGPKAPLRFEPEAVEGFLRRADPPVPSKPGRKRAGTRVRTRVDLLPVGPKR